MSPHPDPGALEAFVLGHHDEIDPTSIESHLAGCDECLDEVGREARLEMLLYAGGREDAFASVLVPRRRPRWPLVAAAAVAVAAAGAWLLWPSQTAPRETTDRETAPEPTAPAAPVARPAWAVGIAPDTAHCSDRGRGGLVCAASAWGATRDDGEAAASDIAIESLLEIAFLRGDPAVREQRALYTAARSAALRGTDRDATRRLRHRVASHAELGSRDTWYWEEYSKLDDSGTEFQVFVRFVASEKEIDEVLAGYQIGRIDGAELVPIIPSVRWVLDPGERMAWFVHRPGRLATLGIRAGDVLLHDQRRNANAIRALIERGEVRIWRDGRFR